MTSTLADLLAGNIPTGLYRAGSHVSARRIQQEAESQGWRAYRINGRKVTGKANFLAETSRALAFPDYQGHNWDAFEESLNDLATGTDGPTLVLFDRASYFAEAAPEEFAVALSILATAVENRRQTAWPMAVVLRGTGEHTPDLPVLRL